MTYKGIELIKRFEGFSPTVYICPAGYPTIGHGHVVLPEEKERFKAGITKEEAEDLLITDLMRLEKRIKPLIKVEINELMLDAIMSFSYNLGIGAFQRSTLRQKLNRGEFIDASDEFLKWVYVGGRKLQGLVLRRQAERRLFLEGVR